jgi:diguanylate cyclase (GGDEF)-like protein/PAS domain S-box-containing protein
MTASEDLVTGRRAVIGGASRVETYSALQESQDRLEAVLDSLPAMVGYWDRGLRNRMANRAYVEFFGKSPEEVLGMPMSELLGTKTFEFSRPYIEGALAGELQSFDRETTTPSGKLRYTHVSYIPDVADGEVRGFFALVTDITERRRNELALEASEERYRTLVEQLPGSIVTLVDTSLRLLWLDGRVVHEEGLDREARLGRPVRETSGGGEHGELIESLYARALNGESVSTEVYSRITRRDFRVEVAPLHGPDGAVIGALGVAQDITERREREAEHEALASIATLVAQAVGPATVFTAVAERLGSLFDASVAAVSRFDAMSGEGRVVGGWSATGDDPTGAVFALDGETASARVFRTGSPAHWDASEVSLSDAASATVQRFAINATVAAPIVVDGSLWGTIGAAFTGHSCPPRVELRLDRFARLVALAISNAEAWATLAQQASTDALTGIANYRTFEARLRSELERAGRYGRDLSLVLLDVDHFKAINDDHGHQTGDRVLAEMARRLVANAREGELVARVGGEEFAWLLPETGHERAYLAADRLRQAIEREPFETVGLLTVSGGVASIAHNHEAGELLRLADKALYRAKEAGRNTTVVYTPDAS